MVEWQWLPRLLGLSDGSIQKCKRLKEDQHDHVHWTLNELS